MLLKKLNFKKVSRQAPVREVDVSIVGASVGLVLVHDLLKGRQILVQLLICEEARHLTCILFGRPSAEQWHYDACYTDACWTCEPIVASLTAHGKKRGCALILFTCYFCSHSLTNS